MFSQLHDKDAFKEAISGLCNVTFIGKKTFQYLQEKDSLDIFYHAVRATSKSQCIRILSRLPKVGDTIADRLYEYLESVNTGLSPTAATMNSAAQAIAEPEITEPEVDDDPMGFKAMDARIAQAKGTVNFIFPENANMQLFYMRAGKVIWNVGMPGTGKTQLPQILAGMFPEPRPVYRVNITDDTTDMHLLGSTKVTTDPQTGSPVTYWLDGPIVCAMREGLDDQDNEVGPPAILIVDEWDAGQPGVMMVLQRLLEVGLDNRRSVMLGEDGGRVVKAHPQFSIILTSNTRATGDNTGMFQGTKPQNAAIIDRINATFEFEFPKLSEVYEGLVNAYFASQLDAFFGDVQKAIINGDIDIAFSIRKTNELVFALRAGLLFWESFELTCLNPFDEEARAVIREIALRHWGQDFEYNA